MQPAQTAPNTSRTSSIVNGSWMSYVLECVLVSSLVHSKGAMPWRWPPCCGSSVAPAMRPCSWNSVSSSAARQVAAPIACSAQAVPLRRYLLIRAERSCDRRTSASTIAVTYALPGKRNGTLLASSSRPRRRGRGKHWQRGRLMRTGADRSCTRQQRRTQQHGVNEAGRVAAEPVVKHAMVRPAEKHTRPPITKLMMPAVAQGSLASRLRPNHSMLAALSNMLCCGCRTYLGWQNPSRALYGTDSATPRAVLEACMAVSKALGPPIPAVSVTRAASRPATGAQAKLADQRGAFFSTGACSAAFSQLNSCAPVGAHSCQGGIWQLQEKMLSNRLRETVSSQAESGCLRVCSQDCVAP